MPATIFAYISDGDSDDWQKLDRHPAPPVRRYQELEGAVGRRAITERAKGIRMERHPVDDDRAFALLREHARNSNRTLIDVATAVVDGHRLLPKQTNPDR